MPRLLATLPESPEAAVGRGKDRVALVSLLCPGLGFSGLVLFLWDVSAHQRTSVSQD